MQNYRWGVFALALTMACSNVSNPSGPEIVIEESTVTTLGGTEHVQVLVPGGTFTMGSSDGPTNERPPHEVTLDAFYIDKFEVTNAQYLAFIEAAGDVKATVIGKPQAGIFLKALNGLGLNANETIMVGDTIDTDIRGAQDAKLRSVLVESGNVNTSNSTADIQVKDISELHKMFAIFDGQKGDLV